MNELFTYLWMSRIAKSRVAQFNGWAHMTWKQGDWKQSVDYAAFRG